MGCYFLMSLASESCGHEAGTPRLCTLPGLTAGAADAPATESDPVGPPDAPGCTVVHRPVFPTEGSF